ncbi:MAG: MFS transporter [Firmicutes bacterium]|nr:MFS transporter [Bacillota bacterium]
MQYLDQFKGLPRQIYLICICRIIMGIGNMTYAFSSLILRSILGLTEVKVAWVMLAMALCTIAGQLFGGHLADLYGRKKVCVTAFALQISVHLISIFLCRHRIMILLMILASFFSAIGNPVFSAMVSDSMDPRRPRECFSLMYLSNNVGVAIGPAIGGLIFYSHMEWTYLIQSVLVGAGITFFAFNVSENYSRKAALQKAAEERALKEGRDMSYAATGARLPQAPEKEQSLLSVINEHKLLRTFILALATVSICYQMTNYMLSMQTTDLFGLEVSSRYSGFVWTTNGIVIVLCTPFLLSMTRKNHHFVNMAIGTCLYALGYGSYSFMKFPFMVVIGAVIWTLGEILISTGAGSFIAANSPPSHVARCQSLYEIARSVGRAVGPLFFGYILTYTSYNTAWRVNSCICLLVSLWVITSWRRAGKPQS